MSTLVGDNNNVAISEGPLQGMFRTPLLDRPKETGPREHGYDESIRLSSVIPQVGIRRV